MNHSFLASDIATIGDSVQGSPLLLTSGSRLQGVPPLHREWDSLQGGPLLQSEWDSPQGVPPLHSEWDSLQGGPLLQSEWDSPQGGPLSNANESRLQGFPLFLANGIRFKEVPFSKANGIRLKGFPLPTANGIRFKGIPFSRANGIRLKGSPSPMRMRVALRGSPSPMRMGFASRGSPSPKRMGFASRDSPSPQRQCFASRYSASPRHQHSSRASSGDNPFERPPSRSSPTSPSSPSKGDREADESSLTAPVKAMIDFILKSFPDAQESPYHPSSRSVDLSAYAGVTDVAIPSGSLLAWCHAMSDAFSDTQQRFAHCIKDGRVCHTLVPILNKFEKVSNSPTQRRELKANPNILDLFRNRIPNISHVPMSLKETVTVERSLKSGLESHNFLTWSVVALIRSLHKKKLLPMDDPVISQLQKSFSKACGSVSSCLNFKCCLRHPTDSPLPCGAFSLRHAEEELALGPVLPDKLSFLFFVCGDCSLCDS